MVRVELRAGARSKNTSLAADVSIPFSGAGGVRLVEKIRPKPRMLDRRVFTSQLGGRLVMGRKQVERWGITVAVEINVGYLCVIHLNSLSIHLLCAIEELCFNRRKGGYLPVPVNAWWFLIPSLVAVGRRAPSVLNQKAFLAHVNGVLASWARQPFVDMASRLHGTLLGRDES